MPDPDRTSDAAAAPASAWWRIAWALAAVAYAVPIAQLASDRLDQVGYKARERLIVQHQLWELNPEYNGTPKTWTRFAARLLSDNQLLRRVRTKYGDLAQEIELDYRRDLSIAQAEVVGVAAGAWVLPVGALYGIGWYLSRRRHPVPTPQPTPGTGGDPHSRYRR